MTQLQNRKNFYKGNEKMEEKKRKNTYTKKEIEIMQLIASGFTDREIAGKIGNTFSYVRNIYARLLLKTGTVNKPHLISWAYREGILKI